jgi:zinc transport system ATP-binding protein
MALINCKNLILGYAGKAVTSPINFKVETGDYLCIFGQNGSGKTTLVKTLLSLNEPIEGGIEMGNGLRKNEIGYLPQQSSLQQDFPASVREIVLSGLQGKSRFAAFYRKNEIEKAEKVMERLGIEKLKNRCYRELSGGQQKKVLLARALLATSKMVLLDEPASSLDPMAAADMYRIIDDLNKNDRIAVIMVSHDPEAALDYASHILYIGKTNLYASKENFIKSDIGETFLNYERREEA